MVHVSASYDQSPSGGLSMADRMATRERKASLTRQLPPCSARALGRWPGLDRARLLRTKGDPARIAALVTPRTVYTVEHVIAMLTKDLEPRP